MRLAWATDIHLNFVPVVARDQLLESIRQQADALVVAGDIAESTSLGAMLRVMDALVAKPVYFVLGTGESARLDRRGRVG